MAGIALDSRILFPGASLSLTQQSRVPQSLAPLSSSISTNTANSADTVTLSPDRSGTQTNDAATTGDQELKSLLQSLRQSTNLNTQTNRPATTSSTASSSPLSSSLQSLLNRMTSRTTGNQQNSLFSGLSNLSASLQKNLEDLFKTDPAQAKKLIILLAALARLNPKDSQGLFNRISSALDDFAAIQQQASAAAQSLASVAQSAGAQSSPPQMEMVHFSLDFEATMSTDTTTLLTELRQEGVQVQATRVQTSKTISIHMEFTGIRQPQKQSDPLVIDLGGDGVNLTGIADGSNFDINGDGAQDRTAFVQGNDAFLALDRNGNGRIDDGKELFGDQNGALNGFEELAKYDENKDGKIDAKDSIYQSLLLLHDKNGDGAVGAFEFATLNEQGIQSIDLSYAGHATDDARGNTLAERAQYTRSDGTRGALVDVWLGYQ